MANSVSRAGREPAALPPPSEVRDLLRGPSIPAGVLNERSKGLPQRSAAAGPRVASRCPDCGHGSSRHTPQGGCMQGKTDSRGRQVACQCNRTFRTSAAWDYLGVPGPPATEYQAPKVKAPKGLKVIKQPKAPAAPKSPASMPAAPKAPKAPAAPKAAKPGRRAASEDTCESCGRMTPAGELENANDLATVCADCAEEQYGESCDYCGGRTGDHLYGCQSPSRYAGRRQAGPGLGLADPESRARWEERRLLDEILGIDDEDYDRLFGKTRDEYDPEPRVSLSALEKGWYDPKWDGLSMPLRRLLQDQDRERDNKRTRKERETKQSARRLRADALSDERSQVVPAQTTAQDYPGGQAMDTGYQPSSTSESAGAALPAEAGGSAAQSPQQSSQGPSGRQEDQMGVDAGAGQGGFGGSGGMGIGDVMGLVSPMVNAGADLASGVASGVGGAISGLGAPGLGGAISGLGGALSGAASGVMSGVSGLGGMFTGAAVEHYYRTGSWHSRTAGGSYDGSWPEDEPWGSLPGGQQVRGEAPKVKRKRKSPRVEWRDGEPYSR